jgi:hypothetical protein
MPLASPLTKEQLDALRSFDTCTVSNAIETFEVRLRNTGFAAARFAHDRVRGHGVPNEIAAEIPAVAVRLRQDEQKVIDFCRSNEFSVGKLPQVTKDLS